MIYRDCGLTSDSLSGRMANTPAISLCSQIAQAGRVGGWKRDGDDGGRRGAARHRAVRNGRDRNEIRQGVTGGKSCILRASSACFAAAKERAQRLAQPRRNSSSTGQWRKRCRTRGLWMRCHPRTTVLLVLVLVHVLLAVALLLSLSLTLPLLSSKVK